MPRFVDLSGSRFGRLYVLRKSLPQGNRVMWLCVCDCGVFKSVQAGNLVSGVSTSCGCMHREQLASRNTVHGMSKDPLYAVWKTMNQRCRNQKLKSWEYYGGRGVKVCDRWDPEKGGSYTNFISDMPPYPGKPYSIDRIDVNGDYCPENCRWATPKEQRANQRLRR